MSRAQALLSLLSELVRINAKNLGYDSLLDAVLAVLSDQREAGKIVQSVAKV